MVAGDCAVTACTEVGGMTLDRVASQCCVVTFQVKVSLFVRTLQLHNAQC